jgi:hypothetical protein
MDLLNDDRGAEARRRAVLEVACAVLFGAGLVLVSEAIGQSWVRLGIHGTVGDWLVATPFAGVAFSVRFFVTLQPFAGTLSGSGGTWPVWR